jgi:hypothetical protein
MVEVMARTYIGRDRQVQSFQKTITSRLVIAVVLLTQMAVAAAQFEPAIGVGIAYTDNIALTTTNEMSETVYVVKPSFSYFNERARVSTSVDYSMDGLYYNDVGESEVFHQFDGDIDAALIPGNLFLNVGASRYQSIIDPEGRVPAGNLPFSVNRVDRDYAFVAPRFEYALSPSVAMEGNYRLSWVRYDEASIDNIDRQHAANFTIDNYRRGNGLTWAARYNWRKTEYEMFDPWEFQMVIGELGFWAGSGLRVFAAGGKESAWDMPLDPGLEDSMWEAGFAKQIGTTLSAEFAAGERSFGSSLRGKLDWEFKNGNMILQYAETPTTEGQNAFNPGSFRVPDDPYDYLVRPGSAQRFIQKQFQWNLNFSLRRSDISLMVFDGQRTDRTEADGTPLQDEDQRGATATFTRQFGARTGLSISGSWIEREFAVDDSSDLIRASVVVSYRLGSRTKLELGYEYAEQNDDRVDASTRDYEANTIDLFLNWSF